jgi:hypothetical protein
MGALAAGPLDEGVRRVLDALDPTVGADEEVVGAVTEQSRELCEGSRAGH